VRQWARPIDRYLRKELEVAGLIEFVATAARVDIPQSVGRRCCPDIGTFMQSVGAAWLIVSLNAGPMYVALTLADRSAAGQIPDGSSANRN
jgi:hypothetical protein